MRASVRAACGSWISVKDLVAKGVAVQGDGRIVLAGSLGPRAHQITNAFVARLASNGALDSSFGSGGALV